MEEFDQLILYVIIKKVVVGAVDNEGKALPNVLTFVLKSGLEVYDNFVEKKMKNYINVRFVI